MHILFKSSKAVQKILNLTISKLKRGLERQFWKYARLFFTEKYETSSYVLLSENNLTSKKISLEMSPRVWNFDKQTNFNLSKKEHYLFIKVYYGHKDDIMRVVKQLSSNKTSSSVGKNFTVMLKTWIS